MEVSFLLSATGCPLANPLSYIYKLNNLTGKFAVHQTIRIRFAYDFEYFMIADKHYLGVTLYFDSKFAIYQWNGTQFVNFQNVSLISARKLRFFTILSERFLAVTTYNSLTSIYKWNDKQFETFQDIASSEVALGVTMFEINNETFIAIANYKSRKYIDLMCHHLYTSGQRTTLSKPSLSRPMEHMM